MRKILFSRPMMFAFGMLAAVLMAQAAAPTPTQPEAPKVGRFQVQFFIFGQSGSSFPVVFLFDTATGRFSSNRVGFRGSSKDVISGRRDDVSSGRFYFKVSRVSGGHLARGVEQYRLFTMDTVTGNWSYEPIAEENGDWRDLVSPAD